MTTVIRRAFPWRTLLVGMVHGLAGSAALLVLAAASISDPATGILYVGLFGIGSILGMALLSAAMAVPLIWTAKAMTWAYRSLQAAAGVITAGPWRLGPVFLRKRPLGRITASPSHCR